MWIAIVAVAVAVLGASVAVGRGRFGEMPERPVTDRPKGHVPDGEVTPEMFAELRIPRAMTGYRAEQVDSYLWDVAAGVSAPVGEPRFDVVRGGYDMQVVDDLVERPRPVPLTVGAQEADALAPQPDTSLPDAE